MPQEAIDLVRIAHLLFFALGMGAGFYVDARTLQRINQPFTVNDIQECKQVHSFVFLALGGLWITGLMLIYIRTGFVLAEFSPKLWVKLAVVTVLTMNAFIIGQVVMPCIERSLGQSAIDLPLPVLLPVTLAASVSMFCWLSGLALGASVTLKTADWPLLSSLFLTGGAVFVLASTAGLMVLRRVFQRRSIAVEAGGPGTADSAASFMDSGVAGRPG